MMQIAHIFHSSIGRKVLMALSGLILFGFVVMHLLGNLQVFLGPEALNAYALKLRHLGPLLWIARGVLLAALVVHVYTSVQLTLENRRGRPPPYASQRTVETTTAARSMMISGIMLTAFLIYHLLHFTFRVAHPELVRVADVAGHADVYRIVVQSFRWWPISLAYLIGVGSVCLHLSHGIGSSAQTLGLNAEKTVTGVRLAGQCLAAAIFIGYASIPVCVLLEIVR